MMIMMTRQKIVRLRLLLRVVVELVLLDHQSLVRMVLSMHVRVVHGGFGYKLPPQVRVFDTCNIGSGAQAFSVLGNPREKLKKHMMILRMLRSIILIIVDLYH